MEKSGMAVEKGRGRVAGMEESSNQYQNKQGEFEDNE